MVEPQTRNTSTPIIIERKLKSSNWKFVSENPELEKINANRRIKTALIKR